MTNEQAKSELMQIYMMLSEEKKQALDVLMAQAEKTCDIEKSNFDVRQYKLDTDTVYECGYNAGLQAQEDGVCDNDCEHCIWTECPKDGDDYKYIKEISKPTGITFEQADRDLISKNNAITSICQWGTTLERTGTYTITVAEMKQTITDMLCELPSVDIPQDHDGCKDCVYQDNPQDAMPCRECKQNYMDKWKAKANKVGHWIDNLYNKDFSQCSKCGSNWEKSIIEDCNMDYCPNCGAKMD